MVCLPGSTDPVTVAEQHMRNSDRPAGHVESPVPSNGHAGFGRRDEETDQSKDRHRASSRPHYQWVYAQPVSTLARELITLRTGRRARRGGRRPPPAPRIREPRYIEERPAEVQGRAVPGHWEGDCATWKAARGEWSYRLEDRSIDEGVTRFSVSRTVPALACVMGDCGVRSPGEKPKPFSFHPGTAGKGKAGRVNAGESSYAS